MKIGIVACEILEEEIESIVKDDPDFVHKEYVEFALHAYPDDMRKKLLEKVNALKGKVDAVFLGYAVCQSLGDFTKAVEVPTVMLSGADCFDVIMGRDEYDKERKCGCLTWFSTPGWSKQGVNGLIRLFHLDSAEGYEPEYFLNMLFDEYERFLFLDTEVGDKEAYAKMSQDFSDGLKLRLERKKCSIHSIAEAVKEVKELAATVTSC
jgi:hypothetical protein